MKVYVISGKARHGKDTVALTSAVLAKLSDDDVKAIMSKIRVIARALPTDKSRMTKLCRELGLVGGMTGDGVLLMPRYMVTYSVNSFELLGNGKALMATT